MSLVIEGREPVHFPKNKDVFQFDGEVAEIFENMAMRSIPMYAEFHRLHASMLKHRIMRLVMDGVCSIFDIGASTGRWFRTLREELAVDNLEKIPGLKCYAFDNSMPMRDKLRKEFPEVTTEHLDLMKLRPYPESADIVVMFYVLQFIPNAYKLAALQWVYNQMRPGAVLVLGQKEQFDDDTHALYQEEYIKFRMANGYTREEIDAKTHALKNAMWCVSPSELRFLLERAGFYKVVETTRWLHFSTVMAYR